MQLASLEPAVDLTERQSAAFASARPNAVVNERFFFGQRLDSFEERFAATGISPDTTPAKTKTETETEEKVADAPEPPSAPRPPSRSLVAHATPRPAAARPAPKLASLTPSPPSSDPDRMSYAADEPAAATTETDSHTAIYDITAHTVYLPNGTRLEAHSGLGEHMDDPHAITAKNRGPTPPNVYELSLREKIFHGVRALRLTPVGDAKMFGRDGILAHSYMLGPNGQSNGCVSFSNYPAFLNAYLKGDVNRLVVVEHLASAPGSKTASDWIPKALKDLFGRS
jgi:Protein of unknown function (DUF2778)